MTERLITVGLINSTEYLQQVRPIWEHGLLVARPAQEISKWCLKYYDEYKQAPERHIEDLYYEKRDSGQIPKNMIKELEELLQDLAREYDESFNVEYALKRTQKYFSERHLEEHENRVRDLRERGEVERANAVASSYRGLSFELSDDLDLSKRRALGRVEHIFTQVPEPLIKYPGALGDILNHQLVRGAFVSLMASEKRGKSFWLLDMAVRAAHNRKKVAFFQAGDMTEGQQLRRLASYLTKLPSSEKYTGTVYVPVIDCLKNQLDTCDLEDRRCNFGPLEGIYDEENIRKEITRTALIEVHEDFEDDYTPCTNCKLFREKPWGTPWLVPKNITHAVNVDEAKNAVNKFFVEKGRRFKISTHPNNTLSVSTIKSILAKWERIDGFVPDVIVIDYADLLVAEHTKEFRHAQNEIWKDLRALSQSRDCLVLTATQADAKSYDANLLKMSHYSEDKRKYAHVTAMFGLNQDKWGREKRIGIMRVNELVIREGDFDSIATVTVLQNLSIGQPFLDSYI